MTEDDFGPIPTLGKALDGVWWALAGGLPCDVAIDAVVAQCGFSDAYRLAIASAAADMIKAGEFAPAERLCRWLAEQEYCAGLHPEADTCH